MELLNEIALRKKIDAIHLEDLRPTSELKDIQLEDLVYLEEYNKEEVKELMDSKDDREYIYYANVEEKQYVFFYWDKMKDILLPFFHIDHYNIDERIYVMYPNKLIAEQLINSHRWYMAYKNLPQTLFIECFERYLFNRVSQDDPEYSHYCKMFAEIVLSYPYFISGTISNRLLNKIQEINAKDIGKLRRRIHRQSYHIVYTSDGHQCFGFSHKQDAQRYLFLLYDEKYGSIEMETEESNIVAYKKDIIGYRYLLNYSAIKLPSI